MSNNTDVTGQAVLWGAVLAFLGVVVTSVSKNWGVDRREKARVRRREDKEARAECARLREKVSSLQAENAGYRAMLFSRGIPLPPVIGEVE